MGETLGYPGEAQVGDATRTLFARTMGFVVGTTAVFAAGAYHAGADPRALWLSGGATALFIGAFGAAGYATRRDLSVLARVSFWALVVLLVFGVVLVLVAVPGGALIYSVVGLLVFAGLTAIDFQRLRRSQDIDSAPLLAATIFLDVLNVFLFFLQIFGDRRGD